MSNQRLLDEVNDVAIQDAESTQAQLLSLKRQTKYLNIINQFSLAIMELNKLDEVYRYVTQDVVAKLGFDDCAIYILNKETNMLENVSVHGIKNTESGETSGIGS
ncbi:MAG: hypothetical protein MJK04_02075, partial [Psychrosphaera sp.]|nr:hypothetical protein [Psychrosphaera sp.]